MNDKSKDLLKKMCFILKIVRWVCLISVVLLIGLSLFYAFNKDVYNTLFGDSGIIGTTKKNLDFTRVSLA